MGSTVHGIAESRNEYYAYKIAEKLGIKSAKVEIIDCADIIDIPPAIKGKATLSYNFKLPIQENIDFIPAKKVIFDNHNDIIIVGSSHIIDGSKNKTCLTMEMLRADKRLEALIPSAIKMAHLDCLMMNTDRHGNNWEIICENGQLKDIAPLFDNGLSFTKTRDFTKFLWDNSKLAQDVTHYDIFSELSVHYPKEIYGLMLKTNEMLS